MYFWFLFWILDWMLVLKDSPSPSKDWLIHWQCIRISVIQRNRTNRIYKRNGLMLLWMLASPKSLMSQMLSKGYQTAVEPGRANDQVWRMSGNRILLPWTRVDLLLYFGIKMIGWDPPILWRLICLFHLPILMLFLQTHLHSNTHMFIFIFFIKFGRISGNIFSTILLPSLSSTSGTFTICVLIPLLLPNKFVRLCSYFFSFFFFLLLRLGDFHCTTFQFTNSFFCLIKSAFEYL